MPRSALIGLYVVTAALGYVLGARDLLPFLGRLQGASSTPLARIGLALRDNGAGASADDWARLAADLDAARAGWQTGEPALFDLLVALRGLRNGGSTDWARAEQSCRAMRWRRCERPALEELKKWGKP